ncbi:MAG: DUF2070 family protein [Candidatus Asgardarchaeia archaeon]
MSENRKALKLYKKLFSLPTMKGMLTLSFSIVLMFSLLTQIPFYKGIDSFVYVFMVYFTSAFLSTIATRALTLKDRNLTLRRLFFLNDLTSIPLFIFWVSSKVILRNLSMELLLIALGIQAALRFLVIYSISSYSLISSLLLSLVQPLMTAMPILHYIPYIDGIPVQKNLFFVELGITLSIWLLGMFAFLHEVTIPFLEVFERSGFEFLKAFSTFWLSKESQAFEGIMSRDSERKRTWVDLIKFRSKNSGSVKGILIIPWIHPGPFSMIGSSEMPKYLIKELEPKWGKVVVLHGPSTHRMNLSSRKEVERLTRIIDEEISKMDRTFDKISPFLRMRGKTFKTFSQKVGDNSLIIATASPKEVDDISYEVGLVCDFMSKMSGFEHGMIVDAHNCISSLGDSLYLGDELSEELIEVSGRVSEELKNVEEHPFKIGFSRRELKYSIEDGYGSGGLSVAVFEIDDKDYALIVFDGNNMIPGLRERIIASVKEFGIEDAEVLTTDTHEVNGIKVEGFGYHPLGEKGDWEYLINEVNSAVKEAMDDLEDGEFDVRRVEVYVDCMGGRNTSLLPMMASVSMKVAKHACYKIFLPILILNFLILML